MDSNQPENKKRSMSKAATPKSRAAKAKYSKRVGSSSPGKNPFSKSASKSSNRSKKSDISDESEEDSQAALEGESNTPLSSPFPGGWETLLPCDNRKALPQIQQRTGRRCILEDTVQFYPAIYQQFISLLGSGVSINVACTCVGWNESTFHTWAYKGACDERDGKDTFFSRLHKDVRRAIASKTADCERSIAEQSPANWLAKGPGRIFGGPWSKPDPNKRLPANANGAAPGMGLLTSAGSDSGSDPTEILDASFTVQPSVTDTEGDELDGDQSQELPRVGNQKQGQLSAGTSLTLTPQQEYEALRVWESIGLIQIDPALKQAFSEQMTNQGDVQPNKDEGDGQEASK